MPIISNSKVYQITLPAFQGPIELLYQLIQKEQLDITEISLSIITEEYIAYIQSYREYYQKDLCSFLEIASHLIYLKSKSLLPLIRDTLKEDEDIEGSYTDELLERILFFSRLEKGIAFLKDHFSPWNYYRERSLYSYQVRGEYSLVLMDLYQFVKTTIPWLSEVKIAHSMSRGEIRPLYLGIEERWDWISLKIQKTEKKNFFGLIVDLSRVDQIISFLTILEKVKQQFLTAYQNELFSDIDVEFVCVS